MLKEIVTRFPVRNSDEQKSAFLAWVLDKAKASGIPGRVETDGKHRNAVFGDPDTAKVIFTAHYDTPRRMLLPNLMLPCSRFLFWCYQIGIVLMILIPSILAGLAAGWLTSEWLTNSRPLILAVYLAVYLGLFLLFFRGRPNPSNVNDNTSGTAAVLGILFALPEEERSKAAFILFDNEEKGKLGSKAYAKAHPEISLRTPLINLDCVGVGDRFVVIERKDFAAHPSHPVLEAALSALPNVCITPANKATANSDHLSFKASAYIGACKRSARGILYTPNIHTPKDRTADENNLSALRGMGCDLIRRL